MNPYEYLLNSITSKSYHNDFVNGNLTLEQAHELLKLTAQKLNLVNLHPDRTDIKDICYQGQKFYAYVGSFPRPHVAIDNASGTTRQYSITTEEELNKIKVK